MVDYWKSYDHTRIPLRVNATIDAVLVFKSIQAAHLRHMTLPTQFSVGTRQENINKCDL